MKVVVTGGRAYKNREYVFDVLDALHDLMNITRLCEGGASGADRWAREWRVERGIDGQTYEARWSDTFAPGAVVKTTGHRVYNVLAGFQRNTKMLQSERPDIVLEFPGGDGTKDCVSRAHDMCILVIEAASLI